MWWCFNALDVEGSLPGSFPLLNKNTCIWSIFVIRLMDQVFCRQFSQRYLLIHLLAAHILNLSAADCYISNAFHAVTLPCPGNGLTVPPHGKQAILKVRKHPIYFMDWHKLGSRLRC